MEEIRHGAQAKEDTRASLAVKVKGRLMATSLVRDKCCV
jgi:hypothetical protein